LEKKLRENQQPVNFMWSENIREENNMLTESVSWTAKWRALTKQVH
jgi:hypothetical protein